MSDQIAHAIREHLGKPGRYGELPLEVLGQDEDRRAMFGWFAELPADQADFAATRALDPDVYDLPRWLDQHD
ncbi:MAG: hypothetical protein ABWX96_04660 [Propionibacteriaceae bacterium]